MKLKSNKVRCNNCNQVIESKHRHDFVACSCFDSYDSNSMGVYVDGGLDYCRRGYGSKANYTDLSEYDD